MSHQPQDNFGRAFARRIAEGLDAHPEWIVLAKSNLDRWSQLNAGAPALLRCYDEWRKILQLPVEEVKAILLDPTDNGQRLRQNSPFAGVFPPAEIWRMKEQARETTSA